MPFGKYKGKQIADIPLNYRQWIIRAFDWNAHNEKLRKINSRDNDKITSKLWLDQ